LPSTRRNERLLVVDDDEDICNLLRSHFERLGFRVETACSLQQMRAQFGRFSFDAVLLDLHLGADDGLDGLPWILGQSPFTKVFILTAGATVERAVDAMKRGASGFVPKSGGPARIVTELLAVIEKSPTDLKPETPHQSNFGIVGQSAAIKRLNATISRIKDIEATVLVTGESGSGKEMVARALHHSSIRSHGRFEAVNCAAIPETLLEAELFGYKRGAFTDAKVARQGLFEICSSGTLLLDEIGEMPLALQAKLLRVLEAREVRPLGSNQSIKINTRVIAATNRDLRNEVRERRFREDLWFRIGTFQIEVPPLRARKSDIPMLVEGFVKQFNHQYGRSIRPPDASSLARLMARDWPGNVRELKNVVERAVVLCTGEQVTLEDLLLSEIDGSADTNLAGRSLRMGADARYELSLVEAKEEFEKSYLKFILEKTGGNIAEAARLAKQHRPNMYRLITKHGLDLNSFKKSGPSLDDVLESPRF